MHYYYYYFILRPALPYFKCSLRIFRSPFPRCQRNVAATFLHCTVNTNKLSGRSSQAGMPVVSTHYTCTMDHAGEPRDLVPELWRGTQAHQIWYLGLNLLNEAAIAAFLLAPVPVPALVFPKGITWPLVPFQRCYCLSCRRFARVSRHRSIPGRSTHRLLLRPSFEGSAVRLPAAAIKTQADNADLTTVEMWSPRSNQPGFSEAEKRQTALKWFGPVFAVWANALRGWWAGSCFCVLMLHSKLFKAFTLESCFLSCLHDGLYVLPGNWRCWFDLACNDPAAVSKGDTQSRPAFALIVLARPKAGSVARIHRWNRSSGSQISVSPV